MQVSTSQIHLQKYAPPCSGLVSFRRNTPELCGAPAAPAAPSAVHRPIRCSTSAGQFGTRAVVPGNEQGIKRNNNDMLRITIETCAAIFPPTGTKRRFTRVQVTLKSQKPMAKHDNLLKLLIIRHANKLSQKI
jgi:hypothetical protein